VVVNVKESSQIVEELLRVGEPVGLDGEGVNLGPNGKLTLVQISTMSGQVTLFDVLTNPALLTQGGLGKLIQAETIVKVVHDCRNDSAALYHQHDVTITNVFDTQAAHAVLELQQTGKPVYKVKNVSLNALCEQYNAPLNPMKDQVKNIYRRDQKFWARRPLSRDMICYAAADVLALVPTIYTAMSSEIKPEFMNLFLSLCEEQSLMYIQSEDVKERKRQRKVETEVADLRLKLATTQSKNIVLSNREIRLLRYVELTEEDKEKLKGSYKVAKKLEKLESKDSRGFDSEEDDDYDCDVGDYPSMESEMSVPSPESSLSPRPSSLAESMQMVDDILSDTSIERLDRIDRIDSILAAAHALNSSTPSPKMEGTKVDAETQTMSTGDIVITKVYFPDGQGSQEPTPQNSPKKKIDIS
jgi:exonuclease 3'-5' domain-containing protein 1